MTLSVWRLDRDKNGALTAAGLHHLYILQNLYQVPITNDNKPAPCSEMEGLPSSQEFFNNFLQLSKPVIFRGAAALWPARRKWTNQWLRKEHGHRRVHVKLAPSGKFEGVESADLWSESHVQPPERVLHQLHFPDLVVVRPAELDTTLSEFLDYVENGTSSRHNVTAYLEYSSLAALLPHFVEDVPRPEMVNNLNISATNVWLSDGGTLGKLHFDPFDNLLCQLDGIKDLILYAPWNNSQMYEAHIPEAVLDYDVTQRSFHRRRRMDSTSMVMSPVDITDPDLERFPEFRHARPVRCTLSPGDILYLPSFWWHEVQSRPSSESSAPRNLAVNFWYQPFLQKEFPCVKCPMDVNPKYRHLL